MNLRPYQINAKNGALEALKTNRSALVVMPTGTGKTVVFSDIVRDWTHGRVMVLAHREELIRQAAEKIHRATGEEPEIEMADERADVHMWKRSRVVVSSIQTQTAGKPKRMTRFNPSEFGLLLIDEAHHSPSSSYQECISYYHQSRVLGFTATPDRSDEIALGKIFEQVAFCYEISDAIRDGYLVPIEQKSIIVAGLDYSSARTTAGDLNQADIARVQQDEQKLQQFVHPIIELSKGRKTIVFATPGSAKGSDPFKISERMTEIFNRHRPDSARRVSQDTGKDERRQILADYREGRFPFLVNVGVLTEGFDEPGIEVVAITRPTKSRSLFAQMIGRGTRPLPGVVDGVPFADARRSAIAKSAKPCVEVLDFEGNAGTHKLVHTADVLGGNYEDTVIAVATAKAKEAGGDVLSHLDEAQKQIDQEKEAARRRAIVGNAKYAIESVDPFDVFDLAPPVTRGWDVGHGPTDRQREILEKNGVRIHDNMTQPQASAIIGEIVRRQQSGRPGFKLTAQLKAKGLPTDVTLGQAMNSLRKKVVTT